jgi:hypothetical protein
VLNDPRLQLDRVEHRSLAGCSMHNLGSGQRVAARARWRGRASRRTSAIGVCCSGGATMCPVGDDGSLIGGGGGGGGIPIPVHLRCSGFSCLCRVSCGMQAGGEVTLGLRPLRHSPCRRLRRLLGSGWWGWRAPQPRGAALLTLQLHAAEGAAGGEHQGVVRRRGWRRVAQGLKGAEPRLRRRGRRGWRRGRRCWERRRSRCLVQLLGWRRGRRC